MKVCAIVVTYNPKISQFHDYLKSNMKQVYDIIIVDNSDDYQLKKQVSSLYMYGNIDIISLKMNYGIAYAQNIGIKKAIEKNMYEFILFLDQDSMLCVDAIKLYMDYFKILDGQYKVACLGVGSFNNMGSIRRGAVEVQELLSSGSFVPIPVLKDVGTMDDTMFIDFVDFEWCWRAISKGYKIFSISEIALIHTEAESISRFFGQKLAIPVPVRHYYQYRNFLNLLKKSYVPKRWKIIKSLKMIIKIPVYIVVAKEKYKRLKYIFNGIKDFFLGKDGKCKVLY